MESENAVLRGKLVETKDQLAVATKEITTTTEKLKTFENLSEERDGKYEGFIEEKLLN